MKNKKGFTMIEILGTVIIMGVILMLIIPGVSYLMGQFRDNYYKKTEDNIKESAENFFSDNRIYRPDKILGSQEVYVNTLVEKKYIGQVKDYKGNICEGSYVIAIYMGNGEYIYHSCLKCSEDRYETNNKKYCDEAWLNDEISYDFGNSNDLYIYYGTEREKVREKLLKVLNAVKYDKNGNELERVVIGNEEEGYLPDNIDKIDSKPILDSNNKKVIPLEYKIKNEIIDNLNAVIYRHKSPSVTIKKISDNSNYTSGTWSNGVIITLNPNDNYLDLTGTRVSSYQWYINGKWEVITCNIKTEGSCSISIKENTDATYRFRLVTNEGNISEETGEYNIKVDSTAPTCSITVEGTSKKTWYNTDVELSLSYEEEPDNESGIVDYGLENTSKLTEYKITTDTRGTTIEGYVKDAAGNTGTCSKNIKRDTVKPYTIDITKDMLKTMNWYINQVDTNYIEVESTSSLDDAVCKNNNCTFNVCLTKINGSYHLRPNNLSVLSTFFNDDLSGYDSYDDTETIYDKNGNLTNGECLYTKGQNPCLKKFTFTPYDRAGNAGEPFTITVNLGYINIDTSIGC